MQAATTASKNIDFGTTWVGQSVDGRFPLQKYLGGSPGSAVFLTQIGGPEGVRAVIKLVLASSCNAEAQLALWRTAARLSHPHLIRIFDGGRSWLAGSDLIFVVMEYAEENLGEVLPRRALTPAEGYAMLRPVMDALKYLHKEGFVHAHLRPSNVMAADELLKISADEILPVGEFKGPLQTSIYDPPEFTAGKISPAADVWSLGAILTEALTRKSTSQSAAYTGLPKPFGEIVHHCLHDEPAARWTIADIETYLQASAAERPRAPAVPSSEVRPVESPRAEIGPGVRRFLPMILVMVLLAIVLAIYFTIRNRPATPPTVTNQPASAVNPAPAGRSPAEPAETANSSAGAVLRQVSPGASKNALRTIHGRIKVRVGVGVDAAGNVENTKLITPGPSKYFARLATQAAEQWKFTPPKQNGQAVASGWTILFEYTRNGITQQADQSSQ
jgi:TonB family protein